MGLGENIRVDPQRKACGPAHVLGAAGEQAELAFGLHVEEQDAGFERGVELPLLLADAGEDGAAESPAGHLAHTRQLAARDDVEARSLGGKQLDDRKRRVGFDGETDGMGHGRERLAKHAQAIQQVLLRVDVERCAVVGGKLGQRYAVAVESSVAVGEWAGRTDGCNSGNGMSDDTALRGMTLSYQLRAESFKL